MLEYDIIVKGSRRVNNLIYNVGKPKRQNLFWQNKWLSLR